MHKNCVWGSRAKFYRRTRTIPFIISRTEFHFGHYGSGIKILRFSNMRFHLSFFFFPPPNHYDKLKRDLHSDGVQVSKPISIIAHATPLFGNSDVKQISLTECPVMLGWSKYQTQKTLPSHR